jgi:hypothetical protein
MLYRVTVIDTDEHEPSRYSRSAKYDEARIFGTFDFEAPAYRRMGHQSRIPEAVVEAATTVAQQYLPDATYNRTVLVKIEGYWPKRIGYGKTDTSWTQTSEFTAFLLNSEHLARRDENSLKRLATL